jgi:hypothetical protein
MDQHYSQTNPPQFILNVVDVLFVGPETLFDTLRSAMPNCFRVIHGTTIVLLIALDADFRRHGAFPTE